jgi:NTE family protein
MKKLGLALGGGGARGCAHVGVIKALKMADIRIDFISGSSIGSIVGAVCASGDIDEFENYLLKINWKDVVKHFDPGVPHQGLFKGNKVVKLLERIITHKKFSELSIPLTVVATNLETGQAVHINRGNVIDAIRASIAIPGIFTPFKKGSRFLIDGGVVNPMPVDVVRCMGADVVIGVDLNHEYIKEKLESRKKKKMARNNIIEWLTPERPNIIDVIESSVFMMQNQITAKNVELNPPDILIRPALGSANIFDFHKSRSMIKVGFKKMKKEIPKLKKLLSNNGEDYERN